MTARQGGKHGILESWNPGILWNLVESNGILWNLVESNGILWNPTESVGIHRNPGKSSGIQDSRITCFPPCCKTIKYNQHRIAKVIKKMRAVQLLVEKKNIEVLFKHLQCCFQGPKYRLFRFFLILGFFSLPRRSGMKAYYVNYKKCCQRKEQMSKWKESNQRLLLYFLFKNASKASILWNTTWKECWSL